MPQSVCVIFHGSSRKKQTPVIKSNVFFYYYLEKLQAFDGPSFCEGYFRSLLCLCNNNTNH